MPERHGRGEAHAEEGAADLGERRAFREVGTAGEYRGGEGERAKKSDRWANGFEENGRVGCCERTLEVGEGIGPEREQTTPRRMEWKYRVGRTVANSRQRALTPPWYHAASIASNARNLAPLDNTPNTPITQELDAALEPILLQQKFKQGGQDMIRLGDNTVPYNEQFRLLLITKLPNPEYAPEVQARALPPRYFHGNDFQIVIAKEGRFRHFGAVYCLHEDKEITRSNFLLA